MTAIVTGGNSGLGRATAQELNAEGAKVYSLDIGGDAMEGVMHIACDVSDPASVRTAVARVEGPIHFLVNSAGIGGLGQIATPDGPGDVEAIRKVIEVNLLGAINVTAEVAHRMIGNDPMGPDDERGVIINACSIASFEGQEGMSAYTAAKAGLAALTLVWARDLGQYNIRCMGIAPGFMATPMVAMLPPDFVDELLKGNEFPKRAGQAHEFASIVTTIIENPLLNGDIIRLDGGARPPARTQWGAGG